MTATAFDDLRQHHRHAGAQQDAELPPRHQPARLELLPILLKMILIAHIRSSRKVFYCNGFSSDIELTRAARTFRRGRTGRE